MQNGIDFERRRNSFTKTVSLCHRTLEGRKTFLLPIGDSNTAMHPLRIFVCSSFSRYALIQNYCIADKVQRLNGPGRALSRVSKNSLNY